MTDTPDSRNWLEKLTDLFSDDPQNRQDIKGILREAASRSVVDSETLAIMEGALQISEIQVRDIMVPRAQMVHVELGSDIQETLPSIIESAHSRFPVLNRDKDEVVGILLAKDLLPLLQNGSANSAADFDLESVMRPVIYIPESKRLSVLLREFRATRNHMAIVIDEFGGVDGLITIEDVLEQIVGDIEDEHDVEEEHLIKEVDKGVFMVRAQASIEEFNEHFDSGFGDNEYDTIGGLVTGKFGRVPECNESIEIDGWNFRVVNGTSRIIYLLEVKKTSNKQS